MCGLCASNLIALLSFVGIQSFFGLVGITEILCFHFIDPPTLNRWLGTFAPKNLKNFFIIA